MLENFGQTSNSKLDIQYSNFYGSQTIWDITVEKQGEINIDFESIIKNGNFKAVLISEKNEISNIFEGTKEGNWIESLSEGKYRIKIVGNDSKGNVKMEIKLDKYMTSNAINNN